MNKSLLTFLKELDKLHLQRDEYAIFGSAPLAARGLREINDLDIVVSDKIYTKLYKKYPDSLKTKPVSRLQIGNLEISNTWLNESKQVYEMIRTADIIDGYPFVKMVYVLKWKKKMVKDMERDKDALDIEIMNKFFKNNN